VTGPFISARRFGWRDPELTWNGPSWPGRVTGAYDPTKHVGGLHSGTSKFDIFFEYALSKSARYIYIY